jgi:hypothetical protein
VFNALPFPATAATATGVGGLNDTNLADFTFLYAGANTTTYGPTANAPVNPGDYRSRRRTMATPITCPAAAAPSPSTSARA